MANGIDIPTTKRKQGKTVSASPSMSWSLFACSIHCGTPLIDQKSLTNIINNIVNARSMSIAVFRWVKLVVVVFIIYIFDKCTDIFIKFAKKTGLLKF
jgi:hypothetical protein